MKITIIYDNRAFNKILDPDWGFSCLIETPAKNILFDTGAKGDILLSNMRILQIDPSTVDLVFISHKHWDHIGGLSDFLKLNPVKVYIPASCPKPTYAKEVITITKPFDICENIYSTGELDNFEQSLVIKQDQNIVVVTGCSHPGVGKILEAASRSGRVNILVGGLHGFNDYQLIENLEFACPVHCTRHIQDIKDRYPGKYIEGGAGKVIEI
jgi:7,8-dihydropterin-6-yl-methyl-4-(beta-D-ribofuranosyl)aminobenzene 5'-phosphate synthase